MNIIKSKPFLKHLQGRSGWLLVEQMIKIFQVQKKVYRMNNYLAIIKYNAGNIGSVANALDRIGVSFRVTNDLEEIKAADKVIFPGVGEASTTMKNLNDSGIAELIPKLTQPVLGICLGMQLMCSWSEEGDTKGLGIFPERVRKFRISEKVPHMGWNSIQNKDNSLFFSLPETAWFYFVHSYYAELSSSSIASAVHGIKFAACLQKNNFYAVQFHPEKSGEVGEQLIKNFMLL